MKFKEYLNEESFKIGDYVYQKGSDYELYGVITKQLKNGSFYASTYTSYNGSTSGKAVQKSMKSWHPPAKKIDKNKIPSKILQKL